MPINLFLTFLQKIIVCPEYVVPLPRFAIQAMTVAEILQESSDQLLLSNAH